MANAFWRYSRFSALGDLHSSRYNKNNPIVSRWSSSFEIYGCI